MMGENIHHIASKKSQFCPNGFDNYSSICKYLGHSCDLSEALSLSNLPGVSYDSFLSYLSSKELGLLVPLGLGQVCLVPSCPNAVHTRSI